MQVFRKNSAIFLGLCCYIAVISVTIPRPLRTSLFGFCPLLTQQPCLRSEIMIPRSLIINTVGCKNSSDILSLSLIIPSFYSRSIPNRHVHFAVQLCFRYGLLFFFGHCGNASLYFFFYIMLILSND